MTPAWPAVGTVVRLAAPRSSSATGVVRELVEVEPGWCGALVTWSNGEQFVDVEKLRGEE